MSMICVKCGKEKATKGSMKHPYCKKCFKEEFKSEREYYEMLKNH